MVQYRLHRRQINIFSSETFIKTTYFFSTILMMIGFYYFLIGTISAFSQLQTCLIYWTEFSEYIHHYWQNSDFDPKYGTGSNPMAYLTMTEVNTLYYMIASSIWFSWNCYHIRLVVGKYLVPSNNHNPSRLLIDSLRQTLYENESIWTIWIICLNIPFIIYYFLQMLKYATWLTPNDHYRFAALSLFILLMIKLIYFIIWVALMLIEDFSDRRHQRQVV